MIKTEPTSKEKKDRLRWLCSSKDLSARLAQEKRELMAWYRTEYKKHLNEFGQLVADCLLV